ncbi:MAG: helix-turn-helix domain-containing protein [Phycisphaerae bacterium]
MERFDPNRPDFAPYGFTCVRWCPTRMQRPDRHNEIEMNFLETGWVTYLIGGRKVRIEAGQLTAFWAALPHQVVDCGDEPEYFVATLPLSWFLQCKLPEAFVQSLLSGQMASENDPQQAEADARLFADWTVDLATPGAGLMEAVLLEMEARLLRMALAKPEATPKSTSPATVTDTGFNKAEQMAQMIARRYVEPLTIEMIADSVSLHPNYAMSLFRKAFGMTLIDYLTQHRVSHAERLLVTTDEKIVQVAIESGFGSMSRFSEAFQRACHCSPREYRCRYRGA